ncbi:MAG: Gfo/Idh/MocA family oxidoreductase [Opitutales bacterium]|nr:Gfo/Idh/MocA family oxidoreductase [Opitutales bacterium]
MKRTLRLGVVGLGEGRSILSAGVESPLWEVAGLCDLDEALGRTRCAEFGLSPSLFTTSLDALLGDAGIDAVGIYTPDALHADHVLAALRAGKHVICTKPFVTDLSRGREILEAEEASGRRVMVGQSSRFFTPFTRQRTHFGEGALGEIITVEAYYHADHRWFLNKPWARKESFKWLYACISHPADLVRWYLPNIEEVTGYSMLSENGRALGLVHPDTFHFVLRTGSGHIARVSGSYSGPTVPESRDSNMSCVLRCSEGASQADYFDLRYAWKVGGRSVVETYADEDAHYFRFEGHSHHAGEYQNYIEYFARCLENGTAPKPDAREGLVTVALMQAMEEASTRGVAVKVRDILDRRSLADLCDGDEVPASASSAGDGC